MYLHIIIKCDYFANPLQKKDDDSSQDSEDGGTGTYRS